MGTALHRDGCEPTYTGNRYSFTGGNPTRFVELDGHLAFLAALAPVAAIVVVVVVAAAVTVAVEEAVQNHDHDGDQRHQHGPLRDRPRVEHPVAGAPSCAGLLVGVPVK